MQKAFLYFCFRQAPKQFCSEVVCSFIIKLSVFFLFLNDGMLLFSVI